MNYKITFIKPFGVLIEPEQTHVNISELNIEHLRTLFLEHQLLLLRGFNTFQNAETFSQYCERWGEISLWPFGKVLELIEQENPADHIFDNNYVPLHWDGMYRPQVPEYQIFHCVKAPLPNEGGRTTFSHTPLALEYLSAEEHDLWKKVTGSYTRVMEFYSSKTLSPIITKHPFKNQKVIRYNEPPAPEKGNFLNPPDLQFTGIPEEELVSFHHNLKKALYAPTNFYAHEWKDNDVVIADNFTLLHGREGFVSKSPRHIQRVHVLSNPPLDNPGLVSYQ